MIPLRKNIKGIIMGSLNIPIGKKDKDYRIKPIISPFLAPILFII